MALRQKACKTDIGAFLFHLSSPPGASIRRTPIGGSATIGIVGGVGRVVTVVGVVGRIGGMVRVVLWVAVVVLVVVVVVLGK